MGKGLRHDELGFSVLEVLVALTLLTGAATACIVGVLQASVRMDDVLAEQVALRHFRSAVALRLNLTSGVCGASLQSALRISEAVPPLTCVDVACGPISCSGHVRWGSDPDQAASL